MSIVSFFVSSPKSDSGRVTRNGASFAARQLPASVAIVTADGELDASNTQPFVDYALHHADEMHSLVIDLSDVGFFGTAGFSALHTLNVRCAGESIDWVVVPSAAVTRMLRICDPDSALPVCDGLDAALSLLQEGDRPLLQLVPEPR